MTHKTAFSYINEAKNDKIPSGALAELDELEIKYKIKGNTLIVRNSADAEDIADALAGEYVVMIDDKKVFVTPL